MDFDDEMTIGLNEGAIDNFAVVTREGGCINAEQFPDKKAACIWTLCSVAAMFGLVLDEDSIVLEEG